MRARTLGAALAAFAAPAASLAESAPTQVVACAAPTLLECSILAPGFDRWFLAPLGIAPSDAEMAEEVCRNARGRSVASTQRRPVRRGLLNNTKVVEVTCAAPQAQPRIVARSPVRPGAGPAPVLAGSPQDFAPQAEGRRASRSEADAERRAERRARREEARLEAREDAENRRRPSASRAAERPAIRSALPSAAPSAKPAAADLTPSTAPSPNAAVQERKPADADTPAAPPNDKHDPSISYEHF